MATLATPEITSNIAVNPVRNLKNSPDVENFFRFIHENGLRKEAKMILGAVCLAQKPVKKRRKRRTKKVQ